MKHRLFLFYLWDWVWSIFFHYQRFFIEIKSIHLFATLFIIFSHFFGLFFITSIIFLVRIAALTSVITMNVVELFTLYLYSVPNILFYTLPISFFIALVIALGKLSSEYELIVITSFGLNPTKILRVFFPVTLILSISLIIVSLGLIPKTKFLTNEMLDFKKREANFNIKSSEYGQKFGEWMIYIDNKTNKVYDEVKLFKTSKSTDEFIISKSATLNNHNSQLSFELSDGKLFNIKANEINQVDFKTMLINESISNKGSKRLPLLGNIGLDILKPILKSINLFFIF